MFDTLYILTRYEDFLRMNERSFCGIFRSDFFFFFFFEIIFSHNQKFLGSKQAPRYTGKRVILMRVLTRLECTELELGMFAFTLFLNSLRMLFNL